MKLSKDINQVLFFIFFALGIRLLNIYQLTTGYTGFSIVRETGCITYEAHFSTIKGAWAPQDGEAQMEGNEPTDGCR